MRLALSPAGNTGSATDNHTISLDNYKRNSVNNQEGVCGKWSMCVKSAMYGRLVLVSIFKHFTHYNIKICCSLPGDIISINITSDGYTLNLILTDLNPIAPSSTR